MVCIICKLFFGLKEELKLWWLGYSLGCFSEGGGKGLNLKEVKSVVKKVGLIFVEIVLKYWR